MKTLTGIKFGTAMECGDFLRAQGFEGSSDGYVKFEPLDNLRIDATFVLTRGWCFLKTKALELPEGITPVEDYRMFTIGMCNGRYCIVNDRGTCVGGFFGSIPGAKKAIDLQSEDENALAVSYA